MIEDKPTSKAPTYKRSGRPLKKLASGVAAVKAGNIMDGAQLLYEVIKLDPECETAWLWLSYCFDNTYQKKYCLSKVLAINPNNQNALEDLARYTQTPRPSINVITSPRSARNETGPLILPQQEAAQISDQIKPSTSTNDTKVDVPGTKAAEETADNHETTPIILPQQQAAQISDQIKSSTSLIDARVEIPLSNIAEELADPPEQDKQSKTRLFLLLGSILVILGIVTYMVVHFSTNNINPKTSVSPTATIVNYSQITYKVWCDNCSDVQFISYVPTSGNSLDIVNLWLIDVPWQTTIQGVDGRQAIVKVSNNVGGTIHCSISVNGKEVTSAVSQSEADCETTINAK